MVKIKKFRKRKIDTNFRFFGWKSAKTATTIFSLKICENCYYYYEYNIKI